MKLTILVSLLVCLSVSISAGNENELLKALMDPVIMDPFLKSTEETLLSLIPDTLEDLFPLVESAFGLLMLGQLDHGTRAVIIPPGLLPAVIPLPPLNLVDADIVPTMPGLLVGNVTCNNVQLEGLHTLTDTVAAGIDTEPVGINANYTIVIPTLSLNSDYLAKITLNHSAIGVIPITGEGASYLNVTKTALNVGLYINQRNGTDGVEFTIKLTFGIDLITVLFENLEPIDVTDLGDLLKEIIVPEIQKILDNIKILNILTLLLDELTKECTFQEIMDFAQGLDGSDLSCVVIPWPPAKPTEPPVEVSEEPERQKNGASVIGFDKMMYLEIFTIIGAFYSAFMH